MQLCAADGLCRRNVIGSTRRVAEIFRERVGYCSILEVMAVPKEWATTTAWSFVLLFHRIKKGLI